ncbi:MAG: alpha-amylase family glycosyl hydrolase, partial [Anaerolineales bacterium]
MEFHVSRQARDRYQFDQALFTFSGNVIFADFFAARQFAQKINQKRDLVNFPEQAVKAGQLNALGLIDEILHYVVSLYRHQRNPQVMLQALEWLESRLGKDTLEKTLLQFTLEFPPLMVYQGKQSNDAYLQGETGGYPNRAVVLEELLMLWVTNCNPATDHLRELFDDSHLSRESAYIPVIKALYEFFETQPPFGPDQQNLMDLLRSPAVAVPYSLFGQLEYIRERWAELIGNYLYRLLSSLDLIKEEEKTPFGGPGPVPIPVYDRATLADLGEQERFSPDSEWMPRLVLIAKNTYVWLDQLSKKYRQSLTRLDQIPDEELDTLARWGFTGLWLIGIWERSRASARIKQLCGNPEAIASAYSLASYEIAQDLGGEEAYESLRQRAWQRGIRLGSDMVPNHMGIDSDWVIRHPDWFISLDYSPFAAYTFNGPDLSSDPQVGIFLEDHYYSRSDAAVVFKWVDYRTGQTRYIYHGNDGTNMPWNDTAQLNYLKPEVREAVIQTILDVARKFPIIRFDAAMTLTKRHYQRLWFPEPGSGGDIPSRAGMGLTKEQFDAAMPNEFWREVVDRVTREVPDTLLLAEAFWLME